MRCLSTHLVIYRLTFVNDGVTVLRSVCRVHLFIVSGMGLVRFSPYHLLYYRRYIGQGLDTYEHKLIRRNDWLMFSSTPSFGGDGRPMKVTRVS